MSTLHTMPNIRAICFDLDNTLWDVWPVIRRAEQAMYDYLAERYPRVVAAHTVETMRAARERTAALYPQMQHDFTFLRLQALRDHARDFGYAETMAEEAFDVFIRARNEVELYDEVLPALEILHRRYRLFTASNGNADLAKIGLAHFFERSVAARQVGALKPDPVIFRKVHRGDRPGARGGGVRRRRSAPGRRGRPPGGHAGHLDQPNAGGVAGDDRTGSP